MRETTAAQCPIHPMETQPCPAADPLPVAWATPSLLVTLSAVEKNHLTNPDRRTRGGEFESAAADAERYSVPLYAAPPAQAEPQEGDLLHTMMEWARTEEGRKQLADSYRPHLWACAKRVADPQNEAATCRHWCGDIEHCQPIASAPAQAEPQPEHAGPIAWLRTLNGDPDWQEDCVHAYEDDARRNLNAYIEGAGEGEVYSIIPLYAASPAQAEPQPDPTPNLGPFSSSLGVAAPDVAARFVEQLCEQNGIVPQYTASGPGTIRCVSWLVARANEDRKALARVLALAAELSAREGLPVAEKLLDGLWHIHKKCGAGLDDKRLMSRIRTKRASELLEGALRAAAYYARGGGKVFAEGMLNVLNKGLQHKFTMGEALEE